MNIDTYRVNAEAVPTMLADLRQWVVWKEEIRNGDKPTKIPYNPTRSTKAQSNNSGTWGTFQQALSAQRRGFGGPGFVFTADDRFVGVDLDGCRDAETGELADWAQEIIRTIDTYAEISPSGTGVKLFLVGKSPMPKGKKKLLLDVPGYAEKTPAVEVYDHGRYFAVTGDRLDGPAEPQERQAQLDSLVARFWPRSTGSNSCSAARNGQHVATPILERARKYVAKMDPAISGQDGHVRAFTVACALCIGFDLGRDDALALMREYNERCEPPWSDHELEHKIEDALQADGERGYLLNKGTNGRPVSQGETRPIVAAETLDLRAAELRTDAANAKRFANRYRDDVRWCDLFSKWHCWNGKHWGVDHERKVEALAKGIAADVWKQTAKLLPNLDHVSGKELTAFARLTASAKGLGAMLSLSRSEPGIPIQPAALNRDPWLLNCENGTLNLRSGNIGPHKRSDLITTLCPVNYRPDATCPRWLETIDLIFAHKRTICGFMRRLLGSALVGQVSEHILAILWGDGSNGKGLFLETVLDVLGADYAGKVPSEMLLATKSDRHPTERADLFGKRLVIASESDDGRRLAEGLVKQLTGGDRIKARRMREDFWEFVPSHTLLLMTNHRPRVYGGDHAIWRRLCLVPFTQRFWDHDRSETGPDELRADKGRRETLKAEHEGILAWLVAGCLEWQADGLKQPSEVTAATAEYRASQDVLGTFFDECCLIDSKWTTKAADLRARYESWCKENGDKPISGRRFGEVLREMEITKKRSNGWWYEGLGLVD